MRFRSRATLLTLAFVLLLSPGLVAAGAEQPMTADQREIVQTVESIFAALRTNDMARLHAVVAPDFYIFDNGRRLDADGMAAMMRTLQAAGKQFVWSVTSPDVHVNGANAWIAYINDGSVTDATGTQKMQWLESAVLEKRAGTWKILFTQSTRVPAAQPAKEAGQ